MPTRASRSKDRRRGCPDTVRFGQTSGRS
jgi:hypothetical protein